MNKTALIVGAGGGLSASVARALTARGYRCALAARQVGKLDSLRAEIHALAIACDAVVPADVDRLFAELDEKLGVPSVVVYNPSARVRGPLVELDRAKVAEALAVSAYGGFLVAQAAVKRMLPHNQGAIVFTGASASIKGYAQSAAFAMGKFALRGLAQSMARELAPQGIHVAHVVIDGGIRSAQRPVPADNPDSLLDPDAIAQTYVHLIEQQRSAWSWEIEVRPWVERF
jgi:NAD(P)-dependent dehydrogenase (short-subunit alcohol dehydrogenase family)